MQDGRDVDKGDLAARLQTGVKLTSRPSSLSMYSVTTLWRLPCSALAFRKASVSASPGSPAAFSRSRSSRRYSAQLVNSAACVREWLCKTTHLLFRTELKGV